MFEHEATKERRWTAPTSESDTSDIKPTTAPVKFSFGGSATVKRKAPSDGNGGGGKRGGKGGKGGGSKFDWQKSSGIDPMDPLGEEAGKNSAGMAEGGRMADSTASGPLFQQRPYPAPGSILRGGAK